MHTHTHTPHPTPTPGRKEGRKESNIFPPAPVSYWLSSRTPMSHQPLLIKKTQQWQQRQTKPTNKQNPPTRQKIHTVFQFAILSNFAFVGVRACLNSCSGLTEALIFALPLLMWVSQDIPSMFSPLPLAPNIGNKKFKASAPGKSPD